MNESLIFIQFKQQMCIDELRLEDCSSLWDITPRRHECQTSGLCEVGLRLNLLRRIWMIGVFLELDQRIALTADVMYEGEVPKLM